MRILIVDDEKNIREILKMNLEMNGYECVALEDGRNVLQILMDQHFDIVLLDVMMPHISGLEVCEQIKVNNIDVPVIFLSAKDMPADKVVGLRKGADDYIAKPFHVEELIVRIEKVLKRSEPSTNIDSIFHFGENWIDFSKYTAYGTHGELTLTRKEIMLLKLLIENKNEVVSRQRILQMVWGYDVYPNTRTIDNFILSFRKYFEKDPKNPEYFHSIRSIGYKFTA